MLLARCAVPHGHAEAREALVPFASTVRELKRAVARLAVRAERWGEDFLTS